MPWQTSLLRPDEAPPRYPRRRPFTSSSRRAHQSDPTFRIAIGSSSLQVGPAGDVDAVVVGRSEEPRALILVGLDDAPPGRDGRLHALLGLLCRHRHIDVGTAAPGARVTE